MAQVIGQVSKVSELPARGKEEPLVSVSVEGIGMLMKPNGQGVPLRGQMVKADVSTYWKQKGRPVHWLVAWVPL